MIRRPIIMIHIEMTLSTFTGNRFIGHESLHKEVENYRKTIFFFISFIKITVFITAQKGKLEFETPLITRKRI